MTARGRIDPLAHLYAAHLFDPQTYGVGTSSGEGVNRSVSFTVNPAFEQRGSEFTDCLVVMMPGTLGSSAQIVFRLQENDGSGGVDIPGATHTMSQALGNHSQANVGRVLLSNREKIITAEIDVTVASAEFACALILCNSAIPPVLQIFGTAFNIVVDS